MTPSFFMNVILIPHCRRQIYDVCNTFEGRSYICIMTDGGGDDDANALTPPQPLVLKMIN